MHLRSTRRQFLRQSANVAAASLLPWDQILAEDVAGPQSLRAHAQARGLLAGCAVVPEKLAGEPAYANTVAEQANLLVAENAMKWKALRPAPDKYNFAPADAILAFANEHNQRVRGHNLCWHEALPDWFQATATHENARELLIDHIEHVAGHFAGKLHSWDVVNEAIDVKDGRPDGLRKSPWLDLIGPDYIEIAFRTARRADSTALLTYNDYGIELDTPEQEQKRSQVLALVKQLRLRGVPIHAVGVQSHLTAGEGTPGAGLREFVRAVGELGMQVFITELDVSDHKLTGSVKERDTAVAKLYGDYLNLVLAEPNVTAVLTWGITDTYSWLNHHHARSDGQPQRCLPFDADYQPTPVFFAMRKAFDARRQASPGLGS
ncbi:endo-1,4-beta-xylanase [Alloacidobacterium dinghuense]|uniref:Beta-xylanase n=1 Tax=Alloacidobacterium dinghuense TaxID=2763107 RepID=A0A7G8BPX6_9BACT|nr:endo-1,4-beta-xylanase [Alloacidobacterium dinghuense]QNI34596.1 endo-1,4-beta-xylanase [Alloacidobacterium dinghuense]